MSNYSLNNGGPYTQANGSAITASSTKIDGGAIKTASTSSSTVRESGPQGTSDFPALYGGIDVGAADYSLIEAYTTTGTITGQNSNGLLKLNGVTGSYTANQLVKVLSTHSNLNTTARVQEYGSRYVVLNYPYSGNVTGDIYNSGVSISGVNNYYGQNTLENYIIKGVPNTTHGVNNDEYRSADLNNRDAVHKLTAMRTTRTATAVRAGYWNPYEGVFTTEPTTANDYGDEMTPKGTDTSPDDTVEKSSDGRTNVGQFAYRFGGPLPVTGDYS